MTLRKLLVVVFTAALMILASAATAAAIDGEPEWPVVPDPKGACGNCWDQE